MFDPQVSEAKMYLSFKHFFASLGKQTGETEKIYSNIKSILDLSTSNGSNYVRSLMYDRSKGVRVHLLKYEPSSPFDVQENNAQACLKFYIYNGVRHMTIIFQYILILDTLYYKSSSAD